MGVLEGCDHLLLATHQGLKEFVGGLLCFEKGDDEGVFAGLLLNLVLGVEMVITSNVLQSIDSLLHANGISIELNRINPVSTGLGDN